MAIWMKMKNMVISLMRGDLCMDLMGSGSWILTIMISVVIIPDLCLQPARTTVPGVSSQLYVTLFVTNISRQTECFFSVEKYSNIPVKE